MRKLLLFVVLLVPVTANAAFYDGNKLYSFCEQDKSLLMGFTAGWLDKWQSDSMMTGQAMISAGDSGSKMVIANLLIDVQSNICVANNVTVGQASDVLCKWLADNPAQRAASGGEVIQTAMLAAFPCK